jgi:hypothetical protein
LFSETSLLKAADNDTVYDYEIKSFVKKENGMPLLKIFYNCYEEDSTGFKRQMREFTDYYDIEKKKFVLSVKTSDLRDYAGGLSCMYDRFNSVALKDHYSDIGMKDGYPIIDYIKSVEPDTVEVGRYEMDDGVYVKKVINREKKGN